MYFRNPSSVFGAYTLDVIASTGFGVDIDSQKNPDSEFVKNAKKFFNITFNPLLLMICKFLNEYPCVYDFCWRRGWGGECVRMGRWRDSFFYTILFWKFNFFIYLFLLRRTKSGKIALYKKRKHDKFSIIKLAKYACWVLVKGFLVKSVLYKCRIFFSLTVMFPKIDALFDLLGISPLNRRNIMGFFRSVASQAVTFRKEDSSVRDLCEISWREIVLYAILWDIRKGDSSVLCEIS